MVRCVGLTTLYERTKRGLDFPSTSDGLLFKYAALYREVFSAGDRLESRCQDKLRLYQ